MELSAVADSINVHVPFALPATADSAQVTVTVTPGSAKTLSATKTATSLDFTFVAPAEGSTISYQACGKAFKQGVAGVLTCNTAQTWKRPITAPGAISWTDTMTVTPK